MPIVDLPREVNEHKNEWVALTLTLEKVAGFGKKPEDAIADAKKKGYAIGDITLLFVPDQWPGVPGLGVWV